LCAQTEDQPADAVGLSPLGRVAAIAAVVIFTWWVERGFKALFDVVT
jgi:hypothetical protein